MTEETLDYWQISAFICITIISITKTVSGNSWWLHVLMIHAMSVFWASLTLRLARAIERRNVFD